MSSKKHKKYKVKIIWRSQITDSTFPPREWDDTDSETKQRTYDFRTKQERDIFLKGVEQAIGWDEYEVVQEREYDE